MGGCLPCLAGDSSDYDAPTPVSMPSSTFLHNLEKEERESISFTSRKFSSSSQANAFSNANRPPQCDVEEQLDTTCCA